MKSIGIITIHKINNYGSVFQAYALQKVCEDMGYKVEIIDYKFPNIYHQNNSYAKVVDAQPQEPRGIKLLFANALFNQHRGIADFVQKYHHLSSSIYNNPDDLKSNPPQYDIYMTGSDQLWNPRHCNGDPAFMLHFTPDESLKISYAASIGANDIPKDLHPLYKELLSRYKYISVRETSGVDVIRNVTGKNATTVLDPTLLVDKNEWNKIATPKRLIKKKYILCYFLNYSFNAFPYVDELANYMQRQTGYEIVRVARPPHKLKFNHTTYKVGASPEEFLALVRDAEIVLTTSFHGTAFAVNFGKPLISIVEDRNASDSRQVSLLDSLCLKQQVLSISDDFPTLETAIYDVDSEQKSLEALRYESKQFLLKALGNE